MREDYIGDNKDDELQCVMRGKSIDLSREAGKVDQSKHIHTNK